MNSVTVSILCYTQLDHVRRCIQSVVAAGEAVDFILTSNGKPQVAAYFESLKSVYANVTVVVNPTNEGFWKPNNHALALCKTKYLVLLNDDMTVPHGWLDVLRAPLEKHADGVFSCPMDTCSELTDTFEGRYGRREYCEGSCLMIKTEIAKRHGLFEPMPGLAYAEDSHASLRFRELGYSLHWVPLAVRHVRAATSRSVPEVHNWKRLNHEFCRKRWAQYLISRRMDYPIIVRRAGAWGDVILTTPVIRALKKKYPQNPIWIETGCGDVFLNNPHVARVERRIREPGAKLINLDGSYEADPAKHFVETYARVAGVELDSTATELYPTEANRIRAFGWLGENDSWIAVHPGPNTWKGKMWPADRFQMLIAAIKEQTGKKVVLVGAVRDRVFDSVDLDLRGKTSFLELAAVLQRCSLLVGLDSAPLHVAQAMKTPVVGLFGVTLPGPIFTEGSLHVAVCSDPTHPESGERHRIAGRTSLQTRSNPMETITVRQVIDAVTKMLEPVPT